MKRWIIICTILASLIVFIQPIVEVEAGAAMVPMNDASD